VGIVRFVKSLFSDEAMGEEIFAANEKAYFVAKRGNPTGTSLDWLVSAYLTRFNASPIVVTKGDAISACQK
jgi:hypothetical protein